MATKYDYSSISATAVRLINRFGRTVVKKAITQSGDSWNPTTTEVLTDVVGAFTNFSKNEIDGTLIKATDKKMLTYNEIVMDDIIQDDGIDYNVVNVDTINPGDTKIIFKVQLRR